MPKDSKSFYMVACHLLKNVHRYYKEEEIIPEIKMETIQKTIKKDPELDIKEEKDVKKMKKCPGDLHHAELRADPCKGVNKQLHEIRTLKKQNRIREQQKLVVTMKSMYGSYRDIAKTSGIALKTVHRWCSIPKDRKHKGTIRADMKREEFTNFLMQNTITYSHLCKRYAGKKFLMHTWQEIHKRYIEQPEFHKHGIMSQTSMRTYKPKCVLLSGQIPVN